MNHNIIDAASVPEPTPKRPNPGIGLSLPALCRGNTPVSQPIGLKKLPEFFRRDDPHRLPPEMVQSHRLTILREIGALSLPALERFVEVMFSDDLVVESYFHPGPLDGCVGPSFDERGHRLVAHPWREAKRAATLAARANCLDDYPYEREFVSVAAWALPSGLFILSHPSVQAKGEKLRNLAQARETTVHIVRDAIKAMHVVSAPQAQAMNTLIGQAGIEGCRPRQISRLGAALFLSQGHINQHWVPVTGWSSSGGGDSDTADSRY